MPTDQERTSRDQAPIDELQIWDRLERRLWSRARMMLIVAAALVLIAALLGVPLIEERIERRVNAQAATLVAERVAAENVNIPALRAEIREETQYQKEQFLESRYELQQLLGTLMERSEQVEASIAAFDGRAERFEQDEGKMQQMQKKHSNEIDRLHKLRMSYDKELREFRETSNTTMKRVTDLTTRELRYIEQTVDRELDELRLIVADQMAGKPAIYSTYVQVEDRTGQLTGLNFGDERGKVFVRVRAFSPGASAPFSESESVLVQSPYWDDNRINIHINAPAMEKIQEARLNASEMTTTEPEFRYGFLVQTAAGKMSQWSAMRIDSIIPPTRVAPKVSD